MNRRGWINEWGWPEPDSLGAVAYEPEDRAIPKATGVLNAKGVMIYRMPEPIGFRLPHTDRKR